MSLELVGVAGGGDLLVANGRLAAQLLEVRLEQLALVGVEGFILAIGVAPPVRKARRDLSGEKTAEQRVAGVGSGGGENGEVMRRLDVEERREQRLEHAPLIETQTIHDDEDGRLVALENREQELAYDIDRQRRPVAFQILEPGRIRFFHVSRELAVHVGIESAQRLVETHLARGRELDIPASKLVVALDPATPVEIGIALELDGAEALDEAAR